VFCQNAACEYHGNVLIVGSLSDTVQLVQTQYKPVSLGKSMDLRSDRGCGTCKYNVVIPVGKYLFNLESLVTFGLNFGIQVTFFKSLSQYYEAAIEFANHKQLINK
jgi:hypothetical protein